MVELVGGRTQLKRAGGRYTGRCPFHEERTPSFSVNPQDKLYYCFGCGAGGDAITFVRETEQLDFGQAVEWLADRFRVPLEFEEGTPADDKRRRTRERLAALHGARDELLRALPVGRRSGRAGACASRGARLRRGGLSRVSARARARRRDARARSAEGGIHARGARRLRGSSTDAGTTTSTDASSSRSPMRVAGSAASRPADCVTTTRFRPSTSTRPRASSSARAISCTAWTRPGARSQSRTAR